MEHDITWLYHLGWLAFLLAMFWPLAKVVYEAIFKDHHFQNMVDDLGLERALEIRRAARGLCTKCGGALRRLKCENCDHSIAPTKDEAP